MHVSVMWRRNVQLSLLSVLFYVGTAAANHARPADGASARASREEHGAAKAGAGARAAAAEPTPPLSLCVCVCVSVCVGVRG